MRSVIVSGGDANYFPLLEELTLSIRRLDEGKTHPIAMLDGGLTDAQKNWFAEQNVQVVDPGWPSAQERERAGNKKFLRVEMAKAALDQLFPEAEILIWLDGDTWLQTWDGIEIMEQVAAKNVLGIVSQTNRYVTQTLSFKPRPFGWIKPYNILYKNARRAGFSRSICKQLIARPTLNAGVFALHRNAPHWEPWRAYRNQALSSTRGRQFTAVQLSLGILAFIDGLPYEPLPEICNYQHNFRHDTARNLLLELGAPYRPASVVHMVGRDLTRTDIAIKEKMLDLNDNNVMQPLRFRARFPDLFR